MGEPLSVDPVSLAPWASTNRKRLLILCADADHSVVELARPQLELQSLQVDIVTNAYDVRSIWSALAADVCPTVVAVVVSRTRARSVARPLIDAFSEVAGPAHRLLILDLGRLPSVLQQVHMLSEAVEGLERTLDLDRVSQAALTASATLNPRASGERSVSPCTMGTQRLRVVHPSVLLSQAVYDGSQTIPARTRFRLGPPRGSRAMPTTYPDLPRIE